MPASGRQNTVYFLPTQLDEKVATLHVPALGPELIVLTQEQTGCTGSRAANHLIDAAASCVAETGTVHRDVVPKHGSSRLSLFL